MRDIVADLDRWLAAGLPVSVATVLGTWGSAPRGVGARMAIAPGPRLAGSVSGGCVESQVAEAGLACLADGRPRRLAFGVADETAWSVGLACGGRIDVLVSRLDPRVYGAIRSRLVADEPVAAATVVGGPDDWLGRARVESPAGPVMDALPEPLSAAVGEAVAASLAGTPPGLRSVDALDGRAAEVFIEAFPPTPTLVTVGAGHIAQALVGLTTRLGWRTAVIDPRAAFATPERFPDVDQMIVAWPDEALRALPLTASFAVAVLSHDPRLDDPALVAALPSPAFYVGALGSPVTQAARRQRLVARGLAPAVVDRLHGPIGLDLGGRAPAEIALAILAEALGAWHGTGRGLRGPPT
jgi:xanthine dehydrogenase accessory factor